MNTSLRTRSAGPWLLGAILALLLTFPAPAAAQVGPVPERSLLVAVSPPLAQGARSWITGTYDRTNVIRIAVVAMAIGLFILLRK